MVEFDNFFVVSHRCYNSAGSLFECDFSIVTYVDKKRLVIRNKIRFDVFDRVMSFSRLYRLDKKAYLFVKNTGYLEGI